MPFQLGLRLNRPKHAPCPVDETLDEGDAFGPLQVLHAAGHSPGHLAFHWPERQLPDRRRRGRDVAGALRRLDGVQPEPAAARGVAAPDGGARRARSSASATATRSPRRGRQGSFARCLAKTAARLSAVPGPLAQLVEQGTLNPKVEGSNPSPAMLKPLQIARLSLRGAARIGRGRTSQEKACDLTTRSVVAKLLHIDDLERVEAGATFRGYRRPNGSRLISPLRAGRP